MRVLAYTSPGRGHLFPLLGIVTELVGRGDQCVVYTLAAGMGDVKRVGARGVAIDPELERIPLEDWKAGSPAAAIQSALATFGERARLEAPDLERAIAAHDPDLVLIDVNCWGAAAAAEASQRRWAMYSPYLLPLPSRGAPPYGPGLAPMPGAPGRVRDAVVRHLLTRAFDRAAMPGVNAARQRYGLPALARFEELLARPPVLLCLTAEGFEYPRRDWPANVRLVGPVNWAPPASRPAALDGLPGPLVLVTCSTEMQADRRLLDTALRALPGAGFSVLATTAAHDPGAFAPSVRTRVARFVSHDAVLDRAVCVVCHGGMGITQKALAAGVPVVAVPFGRDQLETARRVEVARAGVRLPPRRLTDQRLVQAVRTAIARRDGAVRLAGLLRAAGGARAAADALHTLVQPTLTGDAQ